MMYGEKKRPITDSLFIRELSRSWTGRDWAKAIGLLLGVLLAQTLLGYLLGKAFGPPGRTQLGVVAIAQVTGIASPLGFLFARGLSFGFGSMLTMLPQSVPGGAWHFLVPAYAAAAIASARKHRDVSDLLAEGYRPRQILVGLGLGRLAPFLLLAGVFWLLSVVTVPFTLGIGYGTASGLGSAGYGSILLSSLLGSVVFAPLGWMLRASIMVCLSGLSRRLWTAITLCYVFELVVHPAIFFVLNGTLRPLWPAPNSFWIPTLLTSGLILLLEGIALAILGPMAVAAIRSDNSKNIES